MVNILILYYNCNTRSNRKSVQKFVQK